MHLWQFVSLPMLRAMRVSFCFVQFGFVPYFVMLILRRFLSVSQDLFIEILILLVNPLFGVFAGLGHIAEVCLLINCYWHCLHSNAEQGLCNCPMSVRLSVPSGLLQSAAMGLLLWARQVGNIDRLLYGLPLAAAVQHQWRATGECGQCHVVS